MTDPVSLENPPVDLYDPAWTEWNRRHPGPRSLGAAAADEGAGEGGAGEDTSGGGAGEDTAAGAGSDTLGSALGGDTLAGGAQATDWRADLPDDLKDWAKKFTSREAALKSHRELESRLGKSIVLPGENATPEEIAEFRRKALGVPESPEGYEVKLPDNLPDALKSDEEGTKARLGEFAKAMHEAGAPPAAVQAASDFYHKMLAEAFEGQAQALQSLNEQKVAEIEREWGGDKEANITYGKRAVAMFDQDGQFKEFLNSATIDGVQAGNHPEFLRMFARIGRAMAEDRPHMEPTEEEARSVEAEIDKVRRDKADAMRKGDNRMAEQLDRRERELWAKIA